jgi:signal peptidase II
MRRRYAVILSVFIIIADQISKWWITETLLRPRIEGAGPPANLIEWIMHAPPRLGFAQIEILPFFNLTMVWNKGISFGLFNHHTEYGPMILAGLTLVITIAFVLMMVKNFFPARTQMIGVAMIIGGAFGNIIDRVRFGAVADFFDFHLMGYHWPAFNIADSSICIGVLILVVFALFFEKTLPAKT